RALNGIKTVGYVPLRSTIIANYFYPLKQALGIKSGVYLKYFLSIISILISSLFIAIGVMVILGATALLWKIGFALVTISYGIAGFYSLYLALGKRQVKGFNVLKYLSLAFMAIYIIANLDSGMISGQEFGLIIIISIFILLNWLSVNSIYNRGQNA
ncbi:hypothetical protein, partial [Psychromonas sp. Urea-02u-13]|uniref:hypothetical protein n=1 Tax=Psychromonas sp. Urea-02u-13 TaxID=2058326 RepID=UPI000CAC5598